MFTKYTRLILAFLFLFSLSSFAQAYIGPGAGITFIGALIGLVVAVFSAIGFIIFWPIRRAMKKKKAKQASDGEVGEATTETSMEQSVAEDDAVEEKPATE